MTFVLGVLLAALVVPLVAGLVRRGLPRTRRDPAPLDEVEFGVSQRARRSPRHAVLLHRGLVGSFFMLLVAFAVLPAATALVAVGPSIVPAVFAFVLPSLVVGLHVRARGRET